MRNTIAACKAKMSSYHNMHGFRSKRNCMVSHCHACIQWIGWLWVEGFSLSISFWIIRANPTVEWFKLGINALNSSKSTLKTLLVKLLWSFKLDQYTFYRQSKYIIYIIFHPIFSYIYIHNTHSHQMIRPTYTTFQNKEYNNYTCTNIIY